MCQQPILLYEGAMWKGWYFTGRQEEGTGSLGSQAISKGWPGAQAAYSIAFPMTNGLSIFCPDFTAVQRWQRGKTQCFKHYTALHLYNMWTIFMWYENGDTVRPWDARFLGPEKICVQVFTTVDPTTADPTTADPTIAVFGLCLRKWGIFVLVGDPLQSH